MSEWLGGAGFGEVMYALEQARTVDFIRYVTRQLREHEAYATMGFRTVWLIMVVGYVELCTRADGETEDDAS